MLKTCYKCERHTTIFDWLGDGLTDSSEISDDMLSRLSRPSPRPCRQLSVVCTFGSSEAEQHFHSDLDITIVSK